jgi:hypothetical protein
MTDVQNVFEHALTRYAPLLHSLQILAIFAVLLAAYLLFKARDIGWAQLGSPPEMEPDEADPEEQEAGVAVPTDPYTALKQNYDGVVTFLMTVSLKLPMLASSGEVVLACKLLVGLG